MIKLDLFFLSRIQMCSELCERCDGMEEIPCEACNGTGEEDCAYCYGEDICPDCDEGVIDCGTCNGETVKPCPDRQ